MNDLWHSVDLFLGALFSIIMAVLGTLARVGHQYSHGEKISPWQLFWLLPLAIVFGIIALAVKKGLEAYLSVDLAYLDGAVAGGFGLLGPVYFTQLADALLRYFSGKAKGGSDDPSK